MTTLTNRSQLYVRVHCSGFSGMEPNSPEEDFAGSGFLVGSDHVLTCYHVICEELRRSESKIKLEFPFLLNSPFVVEDFSLVYSNVDDDIAVFRLFNPLSFIVNEFDLIDDNCSDLEDTPCLIYYSRNDYDYGLTSAKIKDVIQNGLVQANQTDNSNPVTRGYSGCPVFTKIGNCEFIVGMVRRSNGSGVFNFIPGQTLVSSIPLCKGKTINKYNFPLLPDDYIRCEADYEKAKRLLTDAITTDLKVLLLYGPSGVGKTNMAIDLASHLPYQRKGWVNCHIVKSKEDFTQISGELKSGDLLVIDDLSVDHCLLTQCWLTDKQTSIKCDILITSSNEGLGKVMQLQCDFSKRTKAKLGLSGFQEAEAMKYLEDINESYLDQKGKKRICKLTGNIPILLQMVKQLILTKNQQLVLMDEDDFFSVNNDLVEELGEIDNPDLLAETVVEKLLSSEQITQVSKKVLFVLSKLSLLGGMEPPVLKEVLQCDKDELDESLSFLKKKGFISVMNNPFHGEQKIIRSKIVVMHDLFREIIPKVSKFDITPFSENYLRFIKEQVNQPSNVSIIAKIEGLLLKMQNLWMKQGSGHKTLDFVLELDHCCVELTKLMPEGSAFEEISQFIANRFSSLIVKECYIVIPIAATIARLPKKLILGEMVWQGTKNIYYEEYDNTLARACCIYCAFSHWRALEGVNKSFILERAKIHIRDIYNLSDANSDLEFAAILNGILLMDDIAFVDETIRSERYKNMFKTNFFITLSLIIQLIKIQKGHHEAEFKQKCRNLLNDLIKRDLNKVCESTGKADVIQYLKLNKHDVAPGSVRCSMGCSNPIGMSRTIGLIGFSEDFDSYIIPIRGKHTML